MPPRKPMESLLKQIKKKIQSHQTTFKGKNSRKWNLAKKSKHRHSNESNLQTKIKIHLISSVLLKEVTKPKIYRNTNINNKTKTHQLVSKTRQNPNEKIHKLKQKWWGRWSWLVLGPLLDIRWMQRFFFKLPYRRHSASDEWEFQVMGLITLNERDKTILGLRVNVCGSGDGSNKAPPRISIHGDSDSLWFSLIFFS